MVNKELIDAIEDGNERWLSSTIYDRFYFGMEKCFDAILECVNGCGKDKAIAIIKERFDEVRVDAEHELSETLLYLAKREKGV